MLTILGTELGHYLQEPAKFGASTTGGSSGIRLFKTPGPTPVRGSVRCAWMARERPEALAQLLVNPHEQSFGAWRAWRLDSAAR